MAKRFEQIYHQGKDIDGKKKALEKILMSLFITETQHKVTV